MIALLKSLLWQCACLLIFLVSIDLTTAEITSAGALPHGYTYHPEIKSAYKLYTTGLSWSNARLACIRDGARLAIIDTSEKIGFISSQRQWGSYAWTGIMRDGFLSPWVTVDGSDISTHLPWGLLGYTPAGGGCVAVSGLTGGLCNWPCFLSKSYVCEIPGERQTVNTVNSIQIGTWE